MASLKDLGTPGNILVHNLQDHLHASSPTLWNAWASTGFAQQLWNTGLFCLVGGGSRQDWPSPNQDEKGTGRAPHLLHQGQHEGKGCQAYGSHPHSKGLLRKAGRCVWQLLPKDDLKNLRCAMPRCHLFSPSQ